MHIEVMQPTAMTREGELVIGESAKEAVEWGGVEIGQFVTASCDQAFAEAEAAALATGLRASTVTFPSTSMLCA